MKCKPGPVLEKEPGKVLLPCPFVCSAGWECFGLKTWDLIKLIVSYFRWQSIMWLRKPELSIQVLHRLIFTLQFFRCVVQITEQGALGNMYIPACCPPPDKICFGMTGCTLLTVWCTQVVFRPISKEAGVWQAASQGLGSEKCRALIFSQTNLVLCKLSTHLF